MQTNDQSRAAGSIAEARRMLGGIAHPTISRLINSRQLRTFNVGRRRFVSLAAIQEYIAAAERQCELAKAHGEASS